MEKKINIAELLKNCPKGMELGCTTWFNVTFEKVINDEIYIKRNNKVPSFDQIVVLNKYGCCTNHQDEKCRIFPKGKKTWEGFVPPCKFKDGDIVINASNENSNAFIYAGEGDNYYHSYVGLTPGTYPELFTNKSLAAVHKESGIRFATEGEKQKLFDAIKDNGYKWNAETKTLEKLIEPRFKVGDKVKDKNNRIWFVVQVSEKYFDISVVPNAEGYYVPIADQDLYELVPKKFDVNTLKTFDQVLVRLTNDCVWMPKFFYHYDTDSKMKYYPFITTDNLGYPQCIPYNGNEHLCRTTNNCDEFYRVWEK